jgi:alpha-L-rhamnosidase/Glycosyl hydrolases family 2, sugar binding domain
VPGQICFFLVIALSISLMAQQRATGGETEIEQIYTEFQDPPRDYSPMPFWFWNGKLEGAKVQEEIRRMVDQHVYGAFLHARDGLETPYRSEQWWTAIGAGLEESKRAGFSFNFVDEYSWPSGEVRNIWMAGNHQSEVLARDPGFRMKSLAYQEQVVNGPKSVTLPAVQDLQSIVVGKWLGGGRIDGGSLRLLDLPGGSSPAEWTAPDGDWIIFQFYLQPSMGFDGGVVDLMNPEAMKLYFDLEYGEFYRRFGPYFGNTIHYSFSDHEGVFGYRIAWTPALFETFSRRNGYDLRKMLPLLVYDGGNLSSKVRQDYLATVTQLYQDSFWSGITKRAKMLGIGRSGHAWEENLQSAAAFEGSLFALERGLDPVGVDSLVDFGRQPLNFKVAQSVADFEERRFACENQGVQGTDSYLDMQGLRKATNPIGAWGVNLFIPHAFDYDNSRTNYPPNWLRQPYWPYFHNYADYVRRISYMNSESRHHTNVLLYYPMLSVWADSQPAFSNQTDYSSLSEPSNWKNGSVEINDFYTRIILRLAERQWDHNIADDYYFEQARIEGKELVIGPQHFQAVIVPPSNAIGRKTLKKLQDFYQAGGTVLGIRMLPSGSPDVGADDNSVRDGINQIFGAEARTTPLPFLEQGNAAGGKSYFVAENVETLIDLLDSHVPKDIRIVSGASENLDFEHRQKLGHSYYWVVNDSDRPRTNQVLFSQSGVPEKWDALTGKRSPVFYANRAEGTEVRLEMAAWDAYFIFFRPGENTPQPVQLVRSNATNLHIVSQNSAEITVRATTAATQRDVDIVMRAGGRVYGAHSATAAVEPVALAGIWKFHPEPERVSVPYARVEDAVAGEGEQRGFASAQFDDTAWPSLWLSEAQNTIRDWSVIGPFSNHDDEGFEKVYPPEAEFNPDANYAGIDQERVAWQRYSGHEPYLSKALIWMETSGGAFDDDASAVDFNRAFHISGKPWIASYAHTYLHSLIDQQAVFVVAADNWAKVWLDHEQIFGRVKHPFWYETTDQWADRIPVHLHKGWNEVLLKVGLGRFEASGTYGFTFRVADAQGKTISGIVSSTRPHELTAAPAMVRHMRWYRMEVPPGTTGVLPPPFEQAFKLFLNGQELHQNGGAPVAFENLLTGDRNTLVIEAQQDDRLSVPVEFVTGSTSFALKSWTKTGLAQFSGTAMYETNFTLPSSFQDKRAVLDLGRVSSVAEVYINDRKAGTLIWNPYRLDITEFAKPGENHLKIRVTNTEANARAVGSSHDILPKIDLSGIEGPVQIVPYVDKTFTLKAE